MSLSSQAGTQGRGACLIHSPLRSLTTRAHHARLAATFVSDVHTGVLMDGELARADCALSFPIFRVAAEEAVVVRAAGCHHVLTVW